MSLPDGYHDLDQQAAAMSPADRNSALHCESALKEAENSDLDDSTSAVDTATDASIRKAFREKIPNTTKFIISQRISGVKDADRILVLEEGRVSGFWHPRRIVEEQRDLRFVIVAQTEGGGDFDEREEADGWQITKKKANFGYYRIEGVVSDFGILKDYGLQVIIVLICVIAAVLADVPTVCCLFRS